LWINVNQLAYASIQHIGNEKIIFVYFV
jgi:hypothetical protein